MKEWEKIIFWLLTILLVARDFVWSLAKDITGVSSIPALFPGKIGIVDFIINIILLFIWFWLLLKIYKKAFSKHRQNNEK